MRKKEREVMLMRMQVVVVLMNTRQVYDAGVRKKLPARQTQLPLLQTSKLLQTISCFPQSLGTN